MDNRHESLKLYRYLYQHVVGSEDIIHKKRLLLNISDNVANESEIVPITSGSFGEGLEMKGSDIDIMSILKSIIVCEDLDDIQFDPSKSYFIMDMEDTKPGFTKLSLIYSSRRAALGKCQKIGNHSYLSNNSMKCFFEGLEGMNYIHGPCHSDKNGTFDFATTVHCTSWISPAKKWITRSNRYWPHDDTKSQIISHGVLFVPLGVQGSPTEEFEWRISFSVAEKFLIYSFNHTQFLCYYLLKCLLKVISFDTRCADLLCSYFMKTILFWISEELPLSAWQPENLIRCFMRCFDRLIYCVQHKTLPHYFIPENNLFQSKLSNHKRTILLSNLFNLYSYGWKCLLFYSELTPLLVGSYIPPRHSFNVRKASLLSLYNTKALVTFKSGVYTDIDTIIRRLVHNTSFSNKRLHICALLSVTMFFQEDRSICNKERYKAFKTCSLQCLLKTHSDAVSGWLYLASLFYKMEHYHKALFITTYTLAKCTSEKFYYGLELSAIHTEIMTNRIFQQMKLTKQLRILYMKSILIDKWNPDT